MEAPYGWDKYTHVEVIPKPPPLMLHWRLRVTRKTIEPTAGPPGTPATGHEEITMQLTADQQVELSISGEDAYGNPVDISGDLAWTSSDESIVVVQPGSGDATKAVAFAVGPTGTAAVTVSNDVDSDGTGDFQGSLAIDVVAGDITEIVITPGTPEDKPVVNPL
jgi:hypothetical protein